MGACITKEYTFITSCVKLTQICLTIVVNETFASERVKIANIRILTSPSLIWS